MYSHVCVCVEFCKYNNQPLNLFHFIFIDVCIFMCVTSFSNLFCVVISDFFCYCQTISVCIWSLVHFTHSENETFNTSVVMFTKLSVVQDHNNKVPAWLNSFYKLMICQLSLRSTSKWDYIIVLNPKYQC